jgi:hypothetical protein
VPTAPPPPPVKEAPKQLTPDRIRVGGQVQSWSVYSGPAAFWLNCCNSLSDEQLAKLEERLAAHPEDICAHGQMIANRNPPRQGRTNHLLWMIQQHPEWDGFLLDPRKSLQSGQTEDAELRIREAWLRQVGQQQGTGSALHNAAMFFAIREPELAISLLERAIGLEPNVPIHVERLGMIYGYLQVPAQRFDLMDTPSRQSLSERTLAAVLASIDRALVAGAVQASADGQKGPLPSLAARLKQLTAGEPSSFAYELPSHSSRYRRTTCDAATPVH